MKELQNWKKILVQKNIEPLQGAEIGLFRIRQGDYRIVYSIQD